MATILSLGGSWSSASSWALCDATAESDSETANTAIPTTVAYSSNFTWASAAPTVDGVAIKFATRAASPSGTVTVVLRNTTANSDVRTVTINASDIDASGLGWHFFKFASSVALSNSTNYAVGVSSSVAAQGNLYVTATNNWSRQLRTTATQVPVASDKVIVAGELTGTGTSNALTITLDGDQSAVSLGTTALLQSVHLSKLGTLSYSTVAAANPKLKWKGVFGVYGGGTLNVGTSGTAIPSTSTAELIMDCAANVDSGLVINNGAVVNLYGNPITNVRANLGNGYSSFTPSSTYGGLCNTSGTTITTTSGPVFTAALTHVWVAGVLYKATYVSATQATVSNVAPTYASSGVTVPTYTGAAYLAIYNDLIGAESFSGWQDISAGTTTLTSGQTDPLGGTTAFKLVGNNVNTYWAHANQLATLIDTNLALVSKSYNVTFWARTDSACTISPFLELSSTSAPSVNLTTSWQQFTVTYTTPGGAGANSGRFAFSIGNGNSVYLWRPQLVPGSSAPLFYTPASAFPTTGDIGGYANFTSQSAGGAAGFFTRLQGQHLGSVTGSLLLVSGASVGPLDSTRGIADASQLSTLNTFGSLSSIGYVPTQQRQDELSNWVLSSTTLTSSAVVSPSGSNDAYSLTASAATALHFASRSNPVVLGAQYTCSVYAKYNTHRWIAIQTDSTTNTFASFDLLNMVTGAASAGVTSSVTSIGSGWYRLALTWTATATNVNAQVGAIYLNNADSASGVSYLGTATSSYFWGPAWNTGSSPIAYQTTFSTDISTGWKSGDLIALASTSRTFTDCESGTLTADASGTSCTIFNTLRKPHTHMGEFNISGMNCEILNLSRNIKIHGNSGSLQGYIVVNSTAVVTLRYAEFYWLGSATANKRGLDIATTTGTFDCQYCSLHDFIVTSSRGFNITGASGQTASTLIVSNNNTFNIDERHVIVNGTSGLWTINNNVFMRSTSGPTADLIDVGGIFTNNIAVASASSNAINLQETNFLGTWDGNAVHSCGGNGMAFGSQIAPSPSYVISNLLLWRIALVGLSLTNGGTRALTFSNVTAVGCTNKGLDAGGMGILFKNSSFSSDIVFAQTVWMSFLSDHSFGAVFESCSAGVPVGMRSSHGAGIDISVQSVYLQVLLVSCTLGSATPVNMATGLTGSYVAAQRLNGTAGNHKFWLPYGTGIPDTVIFKAASPSLRLTPNNATVTTKLESAPPGGYGMKAAVASGGTIAVSVWVRKSTSTDASGANYNGNQQRLILRKNVAAGISTDTVLATASAAVGAWEQLTGTTAAVTDDAVLEFVVDCDGTAGWVSVDDWSVT